MTRLNKYFQNQKKEKDETSASFNEQIIDPAKADGLKPDYKINWKSRDDSDKGYCSIFTYGHGEKIAIAAFLQLFPDREIDTIKPINML